MTHLVLRGFTEPVNELHTLRCLFVRFPVLRCESTRHLGLRILGASALYSRNV